MAMHDSGEMQSLAGTYILPSLVLLPLVFAPLIA